MKITTLKRHALAVAIASAALCSQQAIAAGSNVNGSVYGKLVDANGNEVTNVQVILINTDNGSKRTISTGDDGVFRITLPAGTYKLQAVKDGYEAAVLETLKVNLGTTAKIEIPLRQGQYEEVVVLGEKLPQIQTGVAETALNISLDEVSQLPVPRSIEGVALLAPETVLGDSAFGDDKSLVSFGGSSVGENAYYINGLNVTNFRNGLGGSSVPFEFYDQFQIKSGGYGAEFGRSLGGVLNAITKKGSNEFHYGLITYIEPSSLRSTSPDTYKPNGELYDLNSEDERSKTVTDLYVSGPIIQDKLFFYALYEKSDISSDFTGRDNLTSRYNSESDNDFYGLNIHWEVTDGHTLTYTQFSDDRTIKLTEYEYDPATKTTLGKQGVSNDLRGGDNWLIRYDGQLTDDLNISVLHGVNKYNLTTASEGGADENCPATYDLRPTATDRFPGCWQSFIPEVGEDERKATRIDFEWFLGDHNLKFGYDKEVNTAFSKASYSGTSFTANGTGAYYRYQTVSPGTPLGGTAAPDINGDGSDYDVVRHRVYVNGGEYEVRSSAFYIEDTWDVNDQLTISAGLRNETFENLNANGDTFIKIDDQWGPRLGVSYEFNDERSSRVYANWGRYYMPIAANTNIRLAGGEYFTEQYFVLDGALDPATGAPINRDANGVPTSTAISSLQVYSDGSIPDPDSVRDINLDPMSQDETILGFETKVNEDWAVGIRFKYRELNEQIDDITINNALIAAGYPDPGHYIYVLANPGESVTVPYDTDGDGTKEIVTLSADALGYPKAKRTYQAVEITAEKELDDTWGLKASYTYSKNRGNSEGWVKSDNGQDDAGLTTDWDFPELMDGAYGYLPNDRRHTFKVFGNYQATENLLLGVNFVLQSGRPINAFGAGHPNDPNLDYLYGQTYYIKDPDTGEYRYVPRGSMGRTSWLTKLDVSAIYTTEYQDAELEFRVDVFNILDAQAPTEVFEDAEIEPGVRDDRWGVTTRYQSPRTVRLGASIRF